MYSWTVLVTPTTKAILREPARLVNGRAGFLFSIPLFHTLKTRKPAWLQGFSTPGMGYGTWNSQGWVVVLAA